MTVPIPAAASLPQHTQDVLMKVVKPKFDAYFEFTAGGAARAIPAPNESYFIYPGATMISGLVILWSLFSDVYQASGGPTRFARFLRGDAALLGDARRIVEGTSPANQDGSFWHYPNGQVSLDDATDSHLGDVLKTLRNGFAHSHWYLANLSAVDYWRELGWDI